MPPLEEEPGPREEPALEADREPPRLSTAAPEHFGETRVIEDATRRLVERADGFRRYGEQMVLAVGGMGTVYRVLDQDLRRQLAMKVLRTPDAALERGRVGRFLEEAQVTAQLDHPGIVPVHELGIDPRGHYYFTMKLVRGRELGTIFDLAREGNDGWSLPRAISALHKVCEAMAYAHAKGVVHRDLKPSNVMVGRFGEVYVMDWGLARVLGHADEKDIRIRPTGAPETVRLESSRGRSDDSSESPLLTMDGDVVGTPSFMSPEQAYGETERMGPRSDVYALGAMLYQLLTGKVPYLESSERLSPRRILLRLLEGPPPPLRALAPESPGELVSICERAMAREPDTRYASMEALGEDLRAWIEGRVVRAHESGRVAEVRKWVARNPLLAVLGLTVVVTLPVAAIFVTRAVTTRDRVLAAERHDREARIESLVERGYYELGDGDPASAASEFEAAARLAPDRPEIAAGIELALVALGRGAEVLQRLDAREAAGDVTAWIELVRAHALRSEDRRDEAAAIEASVAPPASALDYYLHALGELAQAENRDRSMRVRAVEHLERAILLSTEPRALYYFQWTRALGMQGDPEEVAKAVAVLERHWPESELTLAHTAALSILSGRHAEALAAADELLRRFPGSASGHHTRGKALIELGRIPEAREAFAESLRERPRNHRSLYELARLERAEGDAPAALELLDRAIDLQPLYLPALTLRANVLVEQGNYEQAVLEYREIVRIAPRSTLDWSNLGSILEDLRDFDGAVEAYGRAAEIDPSDARAHFGLGSMLSARGDTRAAIEELERAIELAPDDPRARNNLGVAWTTLGELERGIECYRVAIELDPRHHKARHNLGEAQMEGGDPESAVRSFESALAIQADYPRAWGGLGMALARLGRFEEASRALERATTSTDEPEDPALEIELERVRFFLHLLPSAEDVRAGALAPANEQETLDHALFCVALGHDARAVELFGEYLDVHSDLAPALVDDPRLLASAAALRACSRSGAEGCSALRARALAWLDGSVAALERKRAADPAAIDAVQRSALAHLRHPDLAPVREGRVLAMLSEAESRAWEGVWQRFRSLVSRRS